MASKNDEIKGGPLIQSSNLSVFLNPKKIEGDLNQTKGCCQIRISFHFQMKWIFSFEHSTAFESPQLQMVLKGFDFWRGSLLSLLHTLILLGKPKGLDYMLL